MDFAGFGQELYPLHFWHSLVGQNEGGVFVTVLDLNQEFEGCFAAFGADDAIVRCVFAAQVAFDGAQNGGIVVNGQDEWLCQGLVLTTSIAR